MADLPVRFISGGAETRSLVKYSGSDYCAVVEGADPVGLALLYENVRVHESACRGESIAFPPLEAGVYTFVLSANGRVVTHDRVVYYAEKYPLITPPKGIIYHIFVDHFAREPVEAQDHGVLVAERRDDVAGVLLSCVRGGGEVVEARVGGGGGERGGERGV